MNVSISKSNSKKKNHIGITNNLINIEKPIKCLPKSREDKKRRPKNKNQKGKHKNK